MTTQIDSQKPAVSDPYAGVLAETRDRMNAADAFGDTGYYSMTNPVAGAKRYNASSKTFEVFTGSVWVTLPLSYLQAALNLADIANAAAARTNLGLGTLSTKSAITGAELGDTIALGAPGAKRLTLAQAAGGTVTGYVAASGELVYNVSTGEIHVGNGSAEGGSILAGKQWTTTGLAGKLSLSGGTLTGTIAVPATAMRSTSDASHVRILGGTALEMGASLTLRGMSAPSGAGGFTLRTTNGTTASELAGAPGGDLTWAGTVISLAGHKHQLADITDVTAIPTTTDSVTAGSAAALTSGGAFASLVRRLSTTAATGSAKRGVYVDATGQLQACDAAAQTFDAASSDPISGLGVAAALSTIVGIHSSGINWIRFANGVQVCWGNYTYNVYRTYMEFPVAFSTSPSVVVGSKKSYTLYIDSVSTKRVYFYDYYGVENDSACSWLAIGEWTA